MFKNFVPNLVIEINKKLFCSCLTTSHLEPLTSHGICMRHIKSNNLAEKLNLANFFYLSKWSQIIFHYYLHIRVKAYLVIFTAFLNTAKLMKHQLVFVFLLRINLRYLGPFGKALAGWNGSLVLPFSHKKKIFETK
ncbi:hypothetical protein BpHYR1_019748 [Brachionus plicatilis]|uniref:Uncharacterized protein n=1 Tax=Brachionus plicatilis TaxID=10195 RepID=A0A3M7RYH3_BRAPC|nr:hypothetical protein BpHYR1_019748 [Brachionus plicatilis]